MTQERVYVPLSAQRCRLLAKDRKIDGAQLCAHAVTRALEVANPGAGQEMHEHLAMQAAAEAGLAEARTQGDRLVVAAVDFEAESVEDEAGQNLSPSAVRVTRPLVMQRVASFHLGDEDIAGATAENDSDEEVELSWYDATELDVVLDLI